MPESENTTAKRAGLRPIESDRAPEHCRVCGDPALALYVHIPAVAPSGQFIATSLDESLPEPTSLTLWQCPRCGLVQHDTAYPEGYYDSYFISYRNSEFAQSYQKDLAEMFVNEHELVGRPVVEVGCGDGMFLSFLRDAGAVVVGVERSHRSAEIVRAGGFDVVETGVAEASRHFSQPLAAIATRHVVEHIDDLSSFLAEMRGALAPGGSILIEVPAIEKTIEGRRIYDFIPEHVSYFSAATLGLALERAGFWSVHVRRIIDGEFLVATARTPLHSDAPSEWLGRAAQGFLRFAAARKAAGQSVALWGAGPKCLGLVSEIDGKLVRSIVDSDPLKYGRYTPTPRLAILSPEQFMADPSPVVVITVWTYRDEIARQLRAIGYTGDVMWLGPDGIVPAE